MKIKEKKKGENEFLTRVSNNLFEKSRNFLILSFCSLVHEHNSWCFRHSTPRLKTVYLI